MSVRDYYEIELDITNEEVRILTYHHDDGHIQTNSPEHEKGLPRRVIKQCEELARVFHPHLNRLIIRIEAGD